MPANEKSAPANSNEFDDCPIYWLAIMERAKREADFGLAARAKARLADLGIKVGPPPRRPSAERRSRR